MKRIINSELDTPDGKAKLKEIYVTELGYVMVKLFYQKKGIFINYHLSQIVNILKLKSGQKITLLEN